MLSERSRQSMQVISLSHLLPGCFAILFLFLLSCFVKWRTKYFYFYYYYYYYYYWPGTDCTIYWMKDSLKSFLDSLINLKITEYCWLLTKLIQEQKFRHIKSVSWHLSAFILCRSITWIFCRVSKLRLYKIMYT